MDPDYLERKRLYERQILESINNDREAFAEPERSVQMRGRYFARPSQRRQAHRAASGVELQWHPVAAGQYHAFLRLTPEDQAAYENDPRFQQKDEFGRRYATLGAGPDSGLGIGAIFGTADLKSDTNRPYDVVPHDEGLPVSPPMAASGDQFINQLLKLDREYGDDIPYAFFPDGERQVPIRMKGRRYVIDENSNAYVSGLLTAAGVKPIAPDVPLPGYEHPVPLWAFGRGPRPQR